MRTLFALSLLLYASSARAEGIMLNHLFGCKGNVCVVNDIRGGGNVEYYKLAGYEAVRDKVDSKISHWCVSACVIYASMVRPSVCLMADAKMGIHMGEQEQIFDPRGVAVPVRLWRRLGEPLPSGYKRVLTEFVPDYGKDIVEWALATGKMVPNRQIYELTKTEAGRFWEFCSE
jgi:hypothetical protein